MCRKTEHSYVELFTCLKAYLQPKSVMSDFESAAINAIKKVIPDAEIKGCFFHFCKALYRKIQEKYQTRYACDTNFMHSCKMVMALAYAPPGEMRILYDSLVKSEGFPHDDLADFLTYFEETWLGYKKNRNRTIVKPRFSTELWNIFERTIENLPRTNNAVEGWHGAFNSETEPHAHIYKFISKIKMEQGLQETRLVQFRTGILKCSRLKKYMDKDELIRKKVMVYHDYANKLKYLHDLASMIDF